MLLKHIRSYKRKIKRRYFQNQPLTLPYRANI